jgi:hypothetical protein
MQANTKLHRFQFPLCGELFSVLDVATGRVRQQLALDYDPAVLPHNDEVIDTDNTPPAKGRKAKA